MAPQPITFSASIVCYNSAPAELNALIKSLVQALLQLQQSSGFSEAQIVLVDNSESADWGLELFDVDYASMQAHQIELRLLRGHGNIGFGRGHNLALADLESEFHLILNPDVELESNALLEGIRYLQDNQQVAAVSPYATGYDGRKQHLCKTYPALLTFLVRGFLPKPLRKLFSARLAKYEMHQLSEVTPSKGVPIVSGCFMLCRTAALKQARGFDPGYFLYFEDFDLSLRMGRIAELAYLPSMRIRHAGGHAARKGLRHLRLFARSAMRFYNTHGWRLYRQQ